MTSTNASTTTSTATSAAVAAAAGAPASRAGGDPRPGFAAAVGLARTVITQITADDLGRPTPCDEFDVDALAGHMIGAVRRIAAVGAGEHFATVDTQLSDLGVEQLVPLFDAAVADQAAAWADDAVLGSTLELPFGTIPGAAALGAYISELTTHTWDLATALGVEVDWIDELALGALAAMSHALPDSPRGAEVGIPFGAPVAVADDAPAIERLVAWVGRDPRWGEDGTPE